MFELRDRLVRAVLTALVGIFTLLLIGSGHADAKVDADDSALEIASGFGRESASGSDVEWSEAARRSPLWLIQVNSR